MNYLVTYSMGGQLHHCEVEAVDALAAVRRSLGVKGQMVETIVAAPAVDASIPDGSLPAEPSRRGLVDMGADYDDFKRRVLR